VSIAANVALPCWGVGKLTSWNAGLRGHFKAGKQGEREGREAK